MNKKICEFSRKDLEDVLKVLKKYRTSLKQIGRRSVLSHSHEKEEKVFRIEYTHAISREFLEDFSVQARKKFFPNTPENTQVIYTQNEKLIGGIRLFYGDDMVDMSFQDFMHSLS